MPKDYNISVPDRSKQSVSTLVNNPDLPFNYQSLLASNPWLNYDYTPTFWDDIGNVLNFNTREDEIRREYQQSANEWNSQVAMMAFQNQYNSPVEQAERMRQAGLNPDLTGVSGEPSSGFDTEGMSPYIPNLDTPFQDLFNGVMNAVTTGFDLASKLSGIQNTFLMNEGQKIQNDILDFGANESAFNLVDLISDSMSIGGYHKGLSASSSGNNVKFIEVDPDGEWGVKILDSLPFGNQRNSQRFADAFNKVYHSASNLAKIYGSNEKADISRKNFVRSQGSQYNNRLDDSDEVLNAVSEPLIKLYDKILKGELNLDEWKIYNQTKYQGKIKPEYQAESENLSYQNQSATSTVQLQVNSTIRDIIGRLHTLSKEEGFKGTLASAVLLIFSGLNAIGAPNVGLNGNLSNISQHSTVNSLSRIIK